MDEKYLQDLRNTIEERNREINELSNKNARYSLLLFLIALVCIAFGVIAFIGYVNTLQLQQDVKYYQTQYEELLNDM